MGQLDDLKIKLYGDEKGWAGLGYEVKVAIKNIFMEIIMKSHLSTKDFETLRKEVEKL